MWKVLAIIVDLKKSNKSLIDFFDTNIISLVMSQQKKRVRFTYFIRL
jgi:hypothetical protein